jgi:hypothetical protein
MALEGGEGSASCPGRSLPLGKTQYPLYRRLGGSQGRSGQVWKILPPPEFDPRTVQPIPGRYTDYANQPTQCGVRLWNCLHLKKLVATKQYCGGYATTQHWNHSTQKLNALMNFC